MVLTATPQAKTKASRSPSGVPPEARVAESAHLFQSDIVEMIVGYLLMGDLDTFKACSLTDRSWYITTVPHLHRTLTLGRDGPDFSRRRLNPWFGPQALSSRGLRHFSAFTNVRTLRFEELEIHRFMPDIERYFGHLSPTLRSITLFNPYRNPRQLSHFLSLFSNLNDIEI